jgi:peptidoglycan/LPS O-acetylase OafA/YrhL
MKCESMKFRPDIEGLRAVAVVFVILSHLQLSENLFSGGFVGVDIFFVISGYLITSLLMHEYSKNAKATKGSGWISLRIFYFRRARRLLPAAILVLFATVLFSYVFLNSVKADQTLKDSLFALFFLANLNLISQNTDYFQQGFESGPLQHFWTLSVEEQYYLIFPTLFLITVLLNGLKIGSYRLRWRQRLVVVVGTLTAVSLLWSIIQSNTSPVSGYFSSLTRAWEIGVGSLLAIIIFKGVPKESRLLNTVLASTGVFGIFLSVLIFNSGSLFPGFNALLPTLSTCCLIYVGASSSQSVVTRILSTKVFTFLGKISYSLYLWHLPILILIPQFLEPKLSQGESRVILLIPIFLLSVLTYLFIERPIRTLNPPEKWASRSRSLKDQTLEKFNQIEASLLIVIVVSLAVGFLYSNGTLGVPKSNQQIADASELNTQPTASPTAQAVKPEVDEYQQALTLWQQQLSSGLNITTIPKDLNPPLAALSGYAPGEWGECLNSRIPGCTTGSDDAKKIAVVVGDSYASALFPMVTNALDESEWRVVGIFRGQCMIADVVPIIKGKVDNECSNFRKSWFNYITSAKPDLILLADNFDNKFSVPTNDSTALGYWQTKLAESLKIITSASKNVIYFTAAPTLKALKDCVLANGEIGQGCIGKASARSTKRQIAAGVANSFGVRSIDGREWTCVFQGCPPIVGDVSVYTDGFHFTREFAVTLAPLFRAWLRNEGGK